MHWWLAVVCLLVAGCQAVDFDTIDRACGPAVPVVEATLELELAPACEALLVEGVGGEALPAQHRQLLAQALGSLVLLDSGEQLVDAALRDVLPARDSPREAAWDFVTRRIHKTRVADVRHEEDFDAYVHHGVLHITTDFNGWAGGALLLHEARHKDGFLHRRCPDAPDERCDVVRNGPYDLQRGWHVQLMLHARDGRTHDLHQHAARGLEQHILADPRG